MYKCYNCERTYQEPTAITIAGDGNIERFTNYYCPHCDFTHDNETPRAKQCVTCHDFFNENDNYFPRNSPPYNTTLGERPKYIDECMCMECADNAITVPLWQEFLDSGYGENLPKEFYVEYFFESECEMASYQLVELCKKEYETWVQQTQQSPLQHIKKFCDTTTNDYLQMWAEWLMEEKIK